MKKKNKKLWNLISYGVIICQIQKYLTIELEALAISTQVIINKMLQIEIVI